MKRAASKKEFPTCCYRCKVILICLRPSYVATQHFVITIYNPHLRDDIEVLLIPCSHLSLGQLYCFIWSFGFSKNLSMFYSRNFLKVMINLCGMWGSSTDTFFYFKNLLGIFNHHLSQSLLARGEHLCNSMKISSCCVFRALSFF